jgi:hypothetical protein
MNGSSSTVFEHVTKLVPISSELYPQIDAIMLTKTEEISVEK